FGAVQEDGSVIAVFAETDLRTAHMIARRLCSVMRHTSHGKRDARPEPVVTLANMLPTDSAKSLLARLYEEARRAASWRFQRFQTRSAEPTFHLRIEEYQFCNG